MPIAFPNTQGFFYDFGRAEIDLAGSIFTAISNIKCKQDVEEGIVRGAAAEPLARTRGKLNIGDGTIEFSAVEEAVDFITNKLGDGWAETPFTTTYTLTAPNVDPIKIVLYGCRLLDCEIDHGEGADALPASLPFSFMYRTFNGKTQLKNQRR